MTLGRLAVVTALFAALAAPALAAPFAPGADAPRVAPFPALATPVQARTFETDEFLRLTAVAGRNPIACPSREQADTVLFFFGQSNSANSGEVHYRSRHSGSVFNYFAGSCYEAESPLIGAQGRRGEWMTMVADRLIDAGLARTVVIIPTGVGGTRVAEWTPSGRLGGMLDQTIRDAVQHFNITEIIWHQGEADHRRKTSTQAYVDSFLQIQDVLRHYTEAPIFVSVASRCGVNGWSYPNTVTEAQEELGQRAGLEPGVNTDRTVPLEMRRAGGCHLNGKGQHEVAKAYFYRIWEHRLLVQRGLAAE